MSAVRVFSVAYTRIISKERRNISLRCLASSGNVYHDGNEDNRDIKEHTMLGMKGGNPHG